MMVAKAIRVAASIMCISVTVTRRVVRSGHLKCCATFAAASSVEDGALLSLSISCYWMRWCSRLCLESTTGV